MSTRSLPIDIGPNPCKAYTCLMSAGEVTAIDCLMDDGSESPFPVLQCRNVYVLPGVPHLLRKKWLVSTTVKAVACCDQAIMSLCSHPHYMAIQSPI